MDLSTFALALLLMLESLGADRIDGYRVFERGLDAALAEARRRRLRVRSHANPRLNVSLAVSALKTHKLICWHAHGKYWSMRRRPERVRLIATCHLVRDPAVRFIIRATAVAFLNAAYAQTGPRMAV